MGKRGPAPTPSAIKRARGSWRGKLNPDEPEVSEPMVEQPPAWLISDDARDCWFRVRPLLSWMRKTDENLFARYCERWGVYRERECELRMAVERDEKESLDARIAKLNEQLIRMEAQMGLTPSARTGIKVEDKPRPSVRVRLIQGQRALNAGNK